MAKIKEGQCDPVGTLYGKSGPLFLRVDCGTARNANDEPIYEMSYNAGDGTPILRNVKTGKWFTLTWRDIIKLAELNGIDAPEKGGK